MLNEQENAEVVSMVAFSYLIRPHTKRYYAQVQTGRMGHMISQEVYILFKRPATDIEMTFNLALASHIHGRRGVICRSHRSSGPRILTPFNSSNSQTRNSDSIGKISSES